MEETRAQDRHERGTAHELPCPFCLVMKRVSERRRRHSGFFNHLMNAQIELLQAFRSVIDDQISRLEERKRGGVEKEASKIVVE